jgi:glycosyltransferase involved in cell wall biosynthesis
VTQHIGWIPYRNPLLRTALHNANHRLASPMMKKADKTVFISETVRRYFEDFVAFTHPPETIPNGIDRAVFHPSSQDPRQIRQRLGLDPARPMLVFVGRFVEKKGLPTIEALARRMPEVQWVLAGWGPEHPSRWNLPNVTVKENLRGPSIAELFQAADMLVLPSVGEGFPLVVQESMACGTPALVDVETSTAMPGAKQLLIAESAHGPDRVQRWESRIREALSDGQALSDLGNCASAYVENNWSWEKCGRDYDRIFRSLVRD